MKLLLVGLGSIGSALLQGWQKADTFTDISVISPHFEKSNLDQFPKAKFFHDVLEIEDLAWDYILFAVKPNILPEILPHYQRLMSDRTLFISVAAALPLSRIQEGLGENAQCARVMPNTPVIMNKGVCGLLMPNGSEPAKQKLESLFLALGDTLWVDSDAALDQITAISGCGPAYVFHMIEALADAAENIGFTKEEALLLAKGTVWGAANYAHEANASPTQLRENVTSPGGMTAAALQVLMSHEGLQALMKKAVAAALKRSEEMRASGS